MKYLLYCIMILFFLPVCSFSGINVIQNNSSAIIIDVSRHLLADYRILTPTFLIESGTSVIAIQIRSTTPIVENKGRFYNFQINVEGAVSPNNNPIDITGLFRTVGNPAINVIDQSGIVFGTKESLESIRNIRLNLIFFNPTQIISPTTISASKAYQITIRKTSI